MAGDLSGGILGLALRNLRRQGGRTGLLVFGIAFGVFMMMMVNILAGGTIAVLKENLARMMGGHVFLSLEHREHGRTLSVIQDDSSLVEALHTLGVKDSALSRTVEADGELRFGSRSLQQIQVVGVDWLAEPELQSYLALDDQSWEQVSRTPGALVINRLAAGALGVQVGDPLILKARTAWGQYNIGQFTLAAIRDDDSDMGAITGFASEAAVRGVLDLPETSDYTTLRVMLASLDQTPDFVTRLRPVLARHYPLADSESRFYMLELNRFQKGSREQDFAGERVRINTVETLVGDLARLGDAVFSLGGLFLLLVMVVTALGIGNTFRMIMYERVREIATLRALGMGRNQVAWLVVAEGLWLGVSGFICGVLGAGLVCGLLSLVQFQVTGALAILLDHGRLAFRLDILPVLLAFFMVQGSAVLACLGPAGKTASLPPARGLGGKL